MDISETCPPLDPIEYRIACEEMIKKWAARLAEDHALKLPDFPSFFFVAHYDRWPDAASAAMRFFALADLLRLDPDGALWHHQKAEGYYRVHPALFEAAGVVPLTSDGKFVKSEIRSEAYRRADEIDRIQEALGDD